MKKTHFVFLLLIAFIAAAAFLVRLYSGEDSWICKNGSWIKHGSPSEPAPQQPCEGEPASPETAGFSRSGVAIKDQPGLEAGKLYLLYEEPGKPALRSELIFTPESECGSQEQYIVCMALSVSDYGLYNGRRIAVAGAPQDGKVVVGKLTYEAPYEQTRITGYIRSLDAAAGKTVLRIDEVEFLSGEAAITAGIEDTDCNRQTIADCIPSLNNDFYIRNTSSDNRTLEVSEHTSVKIRENPGSPEQSMVTLQQFTALFDDKTLMLGSFPFHFTLQDGIIISMEELYLP